MRLFGKDYRVDWAHLAIVSVMTIIALLYLFSARQVSTDAQNLLLLQPTAILIALLYVFIVPQCFIAEKEEDSESGSTALQEIIDDAPRVGSLAIALILYAMLYEAIGFDVASLIFCVTASFICGERRLWVLGIFGLLSAIFITYVARFLVSSPIPTSFI